MSRICVDTDVFIATFELARVESTFGWLVLHAVENGRLTGVTGDLTLAELRPKPLAQGDAELVGTDERLLTKGPALKVVAVSRSILVEAAKLRAVDCFLELPDAIHVATALRHACDAVLADDVRLRLPSSLRRVRLTAQVLSDPTDVAP